MSDKLDEVAAKKIPPQDKIIELIYTHLSMIKETVVRNGNLRAEFFRNIWMVEKMRKNFDEDALQELAGSIAQYGLIQPITVRRLPNEYYQIIAGERRWRASRLAGLTEVPVRILEADDRRTAELALVENLQRENLNPIEEAKGYRSLMHDYGLTQEETARSVGRSRPAVANSLRLLSLTGPVMELVEKGELSAGHARALIPIENGAQQLAAAQEVIRKNLSVRKTERMAAKLCRTEAEPEQKKENAALSVGFCGALRRCNSLAHSKILMIPGENLDLF